MDEIKVGLDPRLMGSCTILESQAACSSASRSAMRATFLTQMTVLDGASPRRIITGAEREYGKRTMQVKVPNDVQVLKVIKKYPPRMAEYEFKRNPETTIIYQDQSNYEYGSLVIPSFHCNHKVFGFEFKQNLIVRMLQPGDMLSKDTILANSPSVLNNGDYAYGTELNYAFMSIPGIIEDGAVVSESAIKKLKTRGYGSKVLEWGSDKIPLNTYGTEKEYKYFPDIGERIRPDGILFATRKYDQELAICDMSDDALKEIDYTFDDITYIQLSSVDVNDMPIVEDIDVHHTHNADLWRTPLTIESQVKRYHDAIKIYHTHIYEEYEKILSRRRNKNEIKLTNDFHAQLVRCVVNDNKLPKFSLPKSINRTYRRSKLEDYRVEIKYGWSITPTLGSKISDMHGMVSYLK